MGTLLHICLGGSLYVASKVVPAASYHAGQHLELDLTALKSKYASTKVEALLDIQHGMLSNLREYQASVSRGRFARPEPTPAPGRHAPGSARRSVASLAEHLNLNQEGPSELRMRVDIVFIGFEDEDKHWLRVDHSLLETWFEHLQGTVSHVTLPASEGALAEEEEGHLHHGHDGGSSHGRSSHAHIADEVRYKYDYHVVEVGAQVLEALEASMVPWVRTEVTKTDSQSEGAKDSLHKSYISAWHMERVLGSLVEELQYIHVDKYYKELGLDHMAMRDQAKGHPATYTLFVLNPRRNRIVPRDGVYGYRWGFSPQDMETLATDRNVLNKALEAQAQEEVRWRAFAGGQEGPPGGEASTEIRGAARPAKVDVPQPRPGHEGIGWTDGTDMTSRWARKHVGQLSGGIKTLKEEAIFLLADKGFAGRRALISDILDHAGRSMGNASSWAHGGVSGDTGGRSGCLSDLWVGNGRFAWMDLQAGPFHWGPAVAGTGYKAQDTLPRVPSVTRVAYNNSLDWDVYSNLGLQSMEQDLSRLARWAGTKLLRLRALADHLGCHKGDEKGEGVKGRAAKPACVGLMGQLVLLESFRLGTNLILSEEQELQAGDGMGGATRDRHLLTALADAKGVHLELYQELRELVAPVSEDDAAFPEDRSRTGADIAGGEVPYFLAKLAALTSSLVRHVISPVSALPMTKPPVSGAAAQRRRHGDHGGREEHRLAVGTQLSSGCAHLHPHGAPMPPPQVPAGGIVFPERLTYDLYLVRAQRKYAPLDVKQGGFDLASFQQELLSLRLPGQSVTFTYHEVDMGRDTALATAFYASLKEATVTSVSSSGTPRSSHRRHIDSAALYRHVKAHTWAQGPVGAPSTRRISVFLFSVAGVSPLYVDEHLQARALGDDVVLAVQSEPTQLETRLSCGGAPVHANPRNPMRQMLLAVAQLLGGLVMTHIGYDEARGGITEDWTWAMGQSPCSALVPHSAFGQAQKDVLFRSYVVRALAASQQLTRAAFGLLDDTSTLGSGPVAGLPATAHADFRASQDEFRTTTRRVQVRRSAVVDLAGVLDFEGATRHIQQLMQDSTRVYDLAAEMVELVETARCQSSSAAQGWFSALLQLLPGCGALGGSLWLLHYALQAGPTRTKPRLKIN